MPALVGGIAIYAGISVAAAWAIVIVGAVVLAAGIYMVATMDFPGTSVEAAAQMIKTPSTPCRGIYGEVMTSGPIIFAEEFSGDGVEVDIPNRVCQSVRGNTYCTDYPTTVIAKGNWLHLVIPLAGHPVSGVTEVWFDDELKEEWSTDNWIISAYDGTQETIDDIGAQLTQLPSWSDTMIGKGIPFVHVMLKYDAKVFPSGLPNIKCKVHGKVIDSPFFSGYTTNASAVIYDYLRYHFGATEKMINTESFANEYSICEEAMAGETYEEDGQTKQNTRYSINGGFNYDETHETVLTKMRAACGGSLMFTNGQYYLQVGAYRGPVAQGQKIELGDLSGPVNISTETALNSKINTVKGSYTSKADGFQTADFPAVTNPDYITIDGEPFEHDLTLEFVTNVHQAHRLANIVLKDNRFGITIEVPMNMRAFKFNVGLPVEFADPSLGYDQLEFRVTKWDYSVEKGVTVTLKQTSPVIYNDSVATVKPKPPQTNLPDPKYVAPIESLSFTQIADDNVYDGILTWVHPSRNTVAMFEVVYTSVDGDTTKLNTTDTILRLAGLHGVDYTIMVTAINSKGVRSETVQIGASIGSPKDIIGVNFIPDNFSVVINPIVAGYLPINTSFMFYRSNPEDDTPTFDEASYIGDGKTFSDTGLNPATEYNYFIIVANSAATTTPFGPYFVSTTDDPTNIVDVIREELGSFIWVVYASDAFGSNISFTYNPLVHTYEGRAVNKSTKEATLNPADYYFYKIAEFISPEDQNILDNLANGMQPDGSGPLIGEDDVLFKPGDTVKEVNISDNAISAPKIQANAILADKIAANAVTAVKINAGAVTATKIAAGSVLADKIAANAVTANKIEAGAVTAEKIAVAVVEPIRNFSMWEDLRGWVTSGDSGLVEQLTLSGTVVRTLKFGGAGSAVSDNFVVDHGAIYEFRVSYYCNQGSSFNRSAFALKSRTRGVDGAVGSVVNGERYHPDSLASMGETSQPEFWSGYVTNGWRHMVAYVVGANANIASCPLSVNVAAIIKLKPNAGFVEITNWIGGGGGYDQHLYSPSGIKIGSGEIVANKIRANTSIEAPLIAGGHLTGTTGDFEGSVKAGNIIGDTAAGGSTKLPTLRFNSGTGNGFPYEQTVVEGVIDAQDYERELSLPTPYFIATIVGDRGEVDVKFYINNVLKYGNSTIQGDDTFSSWPVKFTLAAGQAVTFKVTTQWLSGDCSIFSQDYLVSVFRKSDQITFI